MKDKEWEIRVKKLALAFGTGWEYMPGSEEPGSVLTDLFLEMERENRERYEKIGERHKQAFLKVVPERETETAKLKTALSVKVSGEHDGKMLEEGTEVYAFSTQEEMVRFRTVSPVRLTAAKLCCVIRRRGLSAWLTYQEGDGFPAEFFQPAGRELAHPVFRWRFRGTWDGRENFSFTLKFKAGAAEQIPLAGIWTVACGQDHYEAQWEQSEEGFRLSGDCPGFAGHLEGEVYELRLEFPAGEEVTEGWMKALCGGIVLEEKEHGLEPELCITDEGACGSVSLRPFGSALNPAACCYLACDRAVAGRAGELEIRFAESYETEEQLPEPEPKEYERLYKKYPWLRQRETVQDWAAGETAWEYFNGSFWRALPGSQYWQTGCHPNRTGEKRYRWTRPTDMQPCMIEGEEHFYLRLRLCRVQGAYSACWRKYIPVLENILFSSGECHMEPEGQDVPEPGEALASALYLGFDREITADNCWYTGKEGFSFAPGQIKGERKYFGRRQACWAELADGTPIGKILEEPACFLPNYVEILQYEDDPQHGEDLQHREDPQHGEDLQYGDDSRKERDEEELSPNIPEQTAYYVETNAAGMLDAVSVAETRYDRAGAPVREEREAAGHFFSHFGRLTTVMDMEILLQERYPFFRVENCLFRREGGELEVVLAAAGKGRRGLAESENCWKNCPEPGERQEDMTAEIGEWLEHTIHKIGPVWLQRVRVRCILSGSVGQGGKETERDAGTGIAR